MKKRLYNVVSILIGAALAAFALYGNNKLFRGGVFIAFLCVGLLIFLFSLLEFALLTRKAKNKEEPFNGKDEKTLAEYKRKGTMLSRSEMNFYEILKEAFSQKYDILPQVALNSVIDKITQNTYRNELFRVVDFCIVNKDTYAPLLLIELNDSSHNRADRIERDRKVNEICSRAGMPIVTFKTNEISDTSQIIKIINKNMLKK